MNLALGKLIMQAVSWVMLAMGGLCALLLALVAAFSLLPWIGRMLEELAPSRFTAERADSVKGFRILRVARAR